MLPTRLSNHYYQDTIAFLQQNPSLSDYLLAAYDHNIARVTTLIEPVLYASNRCEQARYYIQAIICMSETPAKEAYRHFLATNLLDKNSIHVTAITSNWLIGRNTSCAIFVPNAAVSRRHAVIGYCGGSGFYLTDIGSRNGTKLNQKPLIPLKRYQVYDGDLIQFGPVKVEFFTNYAEDQKTINLSDVTCG